MKPYQLPSAPAATVLQTIDEQGLTLLVDGEVRQISHQLDELKQLLTEKGVQTIQHAKKLYNIEHIDNTNFGIVTEKKAFNEHLTKRVITTIRASSKNANRFLTMMENKKEKDWEKNKDYRNPAKKNIADSFVGIIGASLSQLMAIGDEKTGNQSDYDKENAYIEKCIQIVAHSLALINFALLLSFGISKRRNPNNFYLIFDQFEELYTLGTKSEQAQFIKHVKDILTIEQPIKIIISIREEYLGNLYEFEREVPELLRKKLRVEPMNLEKVKTVVQEVGRLPQSNVRLQAVEEERIAEGIFERIRREEKNLSSQSS